jgi:RNA recognition motif-containing protein
MGRNSYSAGKRQREANKARKRRDKDERRRRNKERNESTAGEILIATVEEIQGGSLRTAEEVVEAVHGAPAGGRSSAGVPCRLFVGGLSWRTNDKDLRGAFEKYGDVAEAVVVMDRDTGDSRGFGFVTMSDRRDAVIAIKKLNGEELDGRNLVVKQATERGR